MEVKVGQTVGICKGPWLLWLYHHLASMVASIPSLSQGCLSHHFLCNFSKMRSPQPSHPERVTVVHVARSWRLSEVAGEEWAISGTVGHSNPRHRVQGPE